MKRFIRNLPIKHKLMAITMATSGAALLLACAIFALYEQAVFRRTMARDFAILADMFDDNVASGLAFNDPASIEQTLQTLKAHQRILAASVYDKQGELVAMYRRPGSAPFEFPAARRTSQLLGKERLDTFKDIELAGEVIGVVYIGAELGELRERAWRYGATVGLLLVGCSLVALGLASRLQRIISQPIVNLAQTVATVATEKDYTVRAPKQSDDELGRLIDGFNEMLAQIEARDSALQNARDKLEERVEERTRDLQLENMERKLAEKALRESEERFSGAFEFAPIGVALVAPDGRWLKVNRALCELVGYTQGELLTRTFQDITYIVDLEADLDHVRRMLAGEITGYQMEKRYIHAHGHLVPVLLNVSLVRDAQGQPRYFISQIQDITSRKQAEARLAETHQQLLASSRQAGMAEVATGVLHNVGNVLNSLNVSSSVIATSLRQSKAESLAKVGALLREQSGNLGAFLTTDAKGRRLPELIESLASHFCAERDRLLKEIESLQSNVDHIKEIVSRQQTHATMVGLVEPLDAAVLMEDSVRMNNGSLAAHEVRLVREFQAVPAVSAEKGKALQILVNLIRNGKQACDESGKSDKVLTLRVAPGAPGRVQLIVVDNGIGIPPENLTRIFAHGFTTKATGHGFGLHSAANAAREMKGTLTVHSDGPGRGTTFTLDLPAAGVDNPPVG